MAPSPPDHHRALPRRPWLALAICLLPLRCLAVPEPSSIVQPTDARSWLARIHAAASQGNYQGTMVFSAGGTMQSSRVWHQVVGDQVYEQIEALDGRQQRIVRHNDAVQTLWPQTRTAVIEKRETLSAWSTTPQEVDPQALEQYELKREPDGRVAGRDAAVFLLEPRDLLRYAQRLWADLLTGLMLRADVIGQGASAASGTAAARPVLESTAFSEIAIGLRLPPDALNQVAQNFRKLDGYRVLKPQQQRTTLDAEGWALTSPVPGFKLQGCVMRGMDATGDDEPVLQAVFADGLTHVSMFIESYKAQRHRGELQFVRGATATLMQRRGDHWITAVGDVPPGTLKLFMAAIERRRP